MSIWNLTLVDGKRLVAVANDLIEGNGDGPTLGELVKAIRNKAGAPDPPDSNVLGFVNPPSPFAKAETELRRLASRIRAVVVERYGEAYAADLWARIRK